MSLVRCEPAVTQLMKQLKGDRLSMRRIRVIKPKMYACLVRGWLTPSLMTPIRQEREVGRSWNREIKNTKVEGGEGAPVVDICFLPMALQRLGAPADPREVPVPPARCLSVPSPWLLLEVEVKMALSHASSSTQRPGFQTALPCGGGERQGGSLARPVVVDQYPLVSPPLGELTPTQLLLSNCTSTASSIR